MPPAGKLRLMFTRAGSGAHPEGVRVDWAGRSGRRDCVLPGLPSTRPGLTAGPQTLAGVHPWHLLAVRTFADFSHKPYFVGCPPVTGKSVSAEAGNVARAGTLRLAFAPQPGESVRAEGGNVAWAGRPPKLRPAFPGESVSAKAGNVAWTGRLGTLCLVFDSGIRPRA